MFGPESSDFNYIPASEVVVVVVVRVIKVSVPQARASGLMSARSKVRRLNLYLPV